MTSLPRTLLPEPRVAPDGKAWRELFRYHNGRLVKANGKPALAFGGLAERGIPYAVGWVRAEGQSDHPNEYAFRAAMRLTCDLYHAANGRRIGANGRWSR